MRFKYAGGWLAVFTSAFFFYMATVTIRWAKPHVSIDPAFFAFARFSLGFIVVTVSMGLQRRSLKANRYRYLLGRTIGNTLAVYCFYQAVETTTLANANILNLTYPIFVTLFAWLFLREQRDGVATAMVLPAFVGIWLIVSPPAVGWDWNNGWGLASGLTASFAIVFLNLSRKHDSAETTLFYMFGLGTVMIGAMFYDRIFWPNPKELYYLLICSFFGVGGQYLLTYGFRYVTAVEGSIITSTRILLAALLGPVLVADPMLGASGWIGALLLFIVNVVLALRKATRHAVP